ncbi:Anaerobic dehydrogenase [Halanaeroarchaeum sp. HSR-CO]|uniref:molybdopterin-containing oxidoreductase family protein n=1 Tax=Halanaeroarchaeum sp. HSR-CO TaxID=2866382 RepID=UPI00217F1A8F|nr:molybdopterin-dependent oxidoreductase [Halanaeroarchaeum sp. HSR-CO]UWG46405.1 Anaerobic dehydrogenase [Halanaeroarchaeum sp. HSR-CO]
MSDASESADDFGLTRRTLLKAGGASAGAAALGGCLSSPGQTDSSAGGTAKAYGNCWQCHKLCGMEVTLENDGDEQVATEIHGIDGHPRGSAGEGTKGTLCPKGLSQLEKAYSPKRIKQPYVRKDGELEAVEWEEAFQYAADRLAEFKAEHGAESLIEFHGWGTTGTFSTLFGNLYGCPNSVPHPTPTCFGSMAVTGTLMGLGGGNIRWVDYPNTKYVLVWGRDPLDTFAGQWEAKQLLQAKERGATIVTIDPVYTETAKKSDKWLPIKPRTDGALALAIANVIIEEELYDEEFVENYTHGFDAYRDAVEGKTPEWAAEKTGLDAEDIRDIALGFGRAAPNAGITSWTGLGQSADHQKGAQNLVALTGLVGNIDRPGGQRWFASASLSNPFKVGCEAELPDNAAENRCYLTDPDAGYASLTKKPVQNNVPRMVEDGVINGMVYYYRNPVTDGATQEWLGTEEKTGALEEMDLVIGIDAFWSETTRNADVVFPESSQLEKPMLGSGGYGAYNTKTWVTGSGAAIDPQWNTKPGFDIIQGLGRAMGYDEFFVWDDKEQYINDQLSEIDLTLEELEAEDTYVLTGDFGYEKWKDGGFAQGADTFWFDLDKKLTGAYEKLSEQVGAEIGTGPQWVPPGTISDELTEEYPLEMLDARTVEFSHGGDQALSKPLEQLAETFDLEHEDYRGNYLVMHTDDAAERDIENGDMVTISSSHGEAELMAFVTEGIRPGAVSVEPYGFGRGSIQPDEEGANNMILNRPDQIDPISGEIDRHIAISVTPAGGEH